MLSPSVARAFSSQSDITIICAARYWIAWINFLLARTIHRMRTRIIAYAIRRLMYSRVCDSYITTYAKLRISLVEEERKALWSNISFQFVLFPRTRIIYTCGYHQSFIRPLTLFPPISTSQRFRRSFVNRG